VLRNQRRDWLMRRQSGLSISDMARWADCIAQAHGEIVYSSGSANPAQDKGNASALDTGAPLDETLACSGCLSSIRDQGLDHAGGPDPVSSRQTYQVDAGAFNSASAGRREYSRNHTLRRVADGPGEVRALTCNGVHGVERHTGRRSLIRGLRSREWHAGGTRFHHWSVREQSSSLPALT